MIFTLTTLTGAVLGKWVGPALYIPILMFAWGLVTLSHALITNAQGYYAVRSFIGANRGRGHTRDPRLPRHVLQVERACYTFVLVLGDPGLSRPRSVVSWPRVFSF